MYERWQNILRKVILFEEISPVKLETMLVCLHPETLEYARGETITAAGSMLRGIGIVLKGKVAIVKDTVTGDRIVMNIVQPGGIFAELAVFSPGRISPVDIIAKDACTVMFIPPDYIMGGCTNACEHHRLLTRNTLALLSGKAMKLTRQISYLVIKSMRGKICTLLYDRYKAAGKPAFALPFNRAEMAEYLGVSRPSLSREMGRLRDEGVIDFEGSQFEIKDPAALKRFVFD